MHLPLNTVVEHDGGLVLLPLRVVCAWCGVLISPGADPCSHGICTECAEDVFPDYKPSPEHKHPPHVSNDLRRIVFYAIAIFLLGLAFLCIRAYPAHAQVTAITEVRNGLAELRVGNPSAYLLRVQVQGLFRDATKDSAHPVTLGDTVHAQISPSAFTLTPGTVQTVRIRVRDSVTVGELLRLATLLTPVDTSSAPGARIVVATKLITKARVVTP